jgi:hypothetical protein
VLVHKNRGGPSSDLFLPLLPPDRDGKWGKPELSLLLES